MFDLKAEYDVTEVRLSGVEIYGKPLKQIESRETHDILSIV